MSADAAYLDSSAFVKMVVAEPQTRALASWLRRWPQQASCSLLRLEAIRAVRQQGPEAVARARTALQQLVLVRLDDELLDAAGALPLSVRSLDAIHLAAALSLGSDLGAVVTYDERMATAARALGLVVASPGVGQ